MEGTTLSEKFTCPVCLDIHPLMGHLRCKCMKLYCEPCVKKGKIRKCLFCKENCRSFNLVTGDDRCLLESFFIDKAVPCVYECGTATATVDAYVQHHRTCVNRQKTIFCTNGCGSSIKLEYFSDIDTQDTEFLVHNHLGNQSCPNSVIQHTCPVCNEEFDTIPRLCDHTLMCECGLIFCANSTRQTLRNHLATCSFVVQTRCSLCGEDGPLSSIREHLYNFHKVIDRNTIEMFLATPPVIIDNSAHILNQFDELKI